jgi:Plasmid pRiA4b ORF-3-like protein
MFDERLVLQVKIEIAGIKPPIWRRLLLPRDLNFAQLHEVIQSAFGWTDSHLHQFIVGGLVIGAPEFDETGDLDRQIFEATNFFLRDLDLYHMPKLEILYEYDFGDSWIHHIEFEKQVPLDKEQSYPLLVDGARHRPPEDVGSTHGYACFLEAWRDPEHDEHPAMRRWAGRAFEPEKFDREKTQKAINTALRKCRKGYRFRLEP